MLQRNIADILEFLSIHATSRRERTIRTEFVSKDSICSGFPRKNRYILNIISQPRYLSLQYISVFEQENEQENEYKGQLRPHTSLHSKSVLRVLHKSQKFSEFPTKVCKAMYMKNVFGTLQFKVQTCIFSWFLAFVFEIS